MRRLIAALALTIVVVSCGPGGGGTQGPSAPELPNAPQTAGPGFSPTTMPSIAPVPSAP